jgi:hypothetical protein
MCHINKDRFVLMIPIMLLTGSAHANRQARAVTIPVTSLSPLSAGVLLSQVHNGQATWIPSVLCNRDVENHPVPL